MAKSIVNPGLWMGLDALFGTDLAKEAHRLGVSYNPKFDTKAATKLLEETTSVDVIDRDVIGCKSFNVENLVSDSNQIAGVFGFDQSVIDTFIGTTPNDKFHKALDLVDFVLAGAKIVPVDQMDEAKECVNAAALTLSKYVPDAKTIGKLLSMVPGLNKYAKYIMRFGEQLDKAVGVLSRNEDNCVRKAIEIIRKGIEELQNLDIEDISKLDDLPDKKDLNIEEIKEKAVDAKVVEEKQEEVKKNSNDNKGNNKKKEEKTVSSNDKVIAEAAAAEQNIFAPFFANTTPVQESNPGNVPQFCADGQSINTHVNAYVPEVIAQNRMNVEPTDFRNSVFNPVEQQVQYDQRLMNYPFVNQIIQIANGLGYMMMPELIVDVNNNPVMIFFRCFNQNAFLDDKSFVVDLGVIIDKRYGIWPCAMKNGAYSVLENCDKAYALYTYEKGNPTNLKTELITNIIKFGFSNLNAKKDEILYGERMLITNRVIDLASMPNDHLTKDKRNIIRGACIRMATSAIEPAMGRFVFKSLNPETMEFTLTNEGVGPNFMIPLMYARPVTEIVCVPKKDENGNNIPCNPNGGSDIVYDITVNTK